MKILMQKFQIGFFGIFDKLSSLCSQNFLFFKRLARKILICLEFLQNNLSSVIYIYQKQVLRYFLRG